MARPSIPRSKRLISLHDEIDIQSRDHHILHIRFSRDELYEIVLQRRLLRLKSV